MLRCPSCDAALDEDFGMVTCKQCQSVLMIDMTGNVHTNTEPMPMSEQSTEGFTFPDDATSGPVYTDSQFGDSENSNTEPIFEEINEEPDAFVSVPESDDSFEAEEEEVSASDFSSSMDSLSGSGSDFATDPVFDPMAVDPDNKPVDISDFANSEESNLEDGEYLYDVQLARIDSKDLRETLKSVLMDEKLKLNHHAYLKNIKDGKVTIPDLNPIKAKRIVEQLHYTDIDIRWVQKRVTMEEINQENAEGKSLATSDRPPESDI